MPLNDIDPNISRHDSLGKSSNISGKIIYKDACYPATIAQSDNLPHAAGVLSMLKTTTETGDIGALSVKQSRLHQIPQVAVRCQPGIAPSRTSSHYSRAGSVRSKASVKSKASNHSIAEQAPSESWPYSHYPQTSSLDLRSSHNGPRVDALHQTSRSIASLSDRPDYDQRSSSLTKMLPSNRPLSKHRSAASLRSQGPFLARPRSPYMYPTRLRRPGFRPASPALSDTNAAPYNRGPSRRSGPGLYASNGSPTPSQSTTESHTQRFVPRLGQTPQQYPSREFHDQPFHGPSRSPKYLLAEPRYQQRVGTPPLMLASTPYYQRPQQPILSNPSPLSNDNSQVASPEPVRLHDPENTPYVGFVQRVKQALEQRVSMEELRRNPRFESPQRRMVEEMEGPVAEMPASPVVKRLTRDMIKAVIGPPSDPGVASSPEGVDYLQAEGSTAGGSSTRADPSLEIPRATLDVTMAISKVVPTSQNNEHDKEASPSDVKITEPADRSTDLTQDLSATGSPANSYVHLDVSPGPNETSTALSNEGGQDMRELSDEKSKSLNELQPPVTPVNCRKRWTSLPQSQTTIKAETRMTNHQSLPVSLEIGRRSTPTIVGELQPERASPGARPSTTSVEVEVTVPPEAGPTPSSAQASSHASSTLTGVIDVPTWATSSLKARSRSKVYSLESRNESSQIQDENHPKSRIGAALAQVPNRAVHAILAKDSALPADNSVSASAGPAAAGAGGAVIGDRLSAMKQFHFPLPDLTEDSQEDTSTTNLRMLGSRPPNFRMGGLKQMKREFRAAPPVSTVLESPASYVSRKLVNTRNMPSLNFSQMDLTTKLNIALKLRSSHSAETLKSVPECDSPHSTTEHPAASNVLRERYKSFFSDGDVVDDVDETSGEISDKHLSSTQKHLSNEEFVTEIERLSIPSVNALTLRLSELLPAIKRCSSQLDLTGGDENVNSTIGESPGLGSLERTQSMERKELAMASALSAGNFARSRRSVLGKLSATNRTSASEMCQLRLMKELPPLPQENDASKQKSALGFNPENVVDLPAELEATVPLAEVDQGSPDTDHPARSSTPAQKPKLTGQPSKLSMAETSDSRPWNTTTNYPWHVASHASEASSLQPGHDHLSLQFLERQEHDSTPMTGAGLSLNTAERIVRSMSPGPHVDNFLVPQSPLEDEIEPTAQKHTGFIGSIQRKVGIKPRIDKAGFPVDPIFLHPEERYTEPGDRYPTTGLTPPSHANMEEARSYFSDDSSEHERARVGTLRKRLTRLRQRQSGTRRSTQIRSASQADSRREIPRAVFWPGVRESMSDQSNTSGTHPNFVTVYDQPPAGMSKLEYRAKRIVEKLRILWCRGGNAIRSMSRARKHSQVWYEPEELYDGV